MKESRQGQKPNLLNFANNVLLSKDKRGAYNISTGEQSPDTGYFVPLVREDCSEVSKERIHEFWKRNSTLLADDNLWLAIHHDGRSWIYTVSDLVPTREWAIERAWGLGEVDIIENSTGNSWNVKLGKSS